MISPSQGTTRQSSVLTSDSKPNHHRLIGPNNEDIIQVNDLNYRALIDSGSQITSITTDLWKQHPKLKDIQLASAEVSIESASGHQIPFLGVIPISLTILGVVYEDVPAFVVPEDSYRKEVPVLIGTNVIRAAKQDQEVAKGKNFLRQLHTENPVWHTAFTSATTSDLGDQHGSIGYARYVGRFPRVIGPGKEEDIICQAPQRGSPYTAVIEAFPESSSSCLKVSNLIADVGPNSRVPVRLCNISAKPITIRRNCKLAQLSSVLRIEEIPTDSTANLEKREKTDDKQPSLADQSRESHDPAVTNAVPSLDLSKAKLDSETQRKQLHNLLQEYADVFSSSSLDFGCTSTVKHCIPLIDNQPFRLPHRRIPPSQYQAVKDHLKGMEEAGVIRKSCSPYASPILVAYKKDGSIRLCIDYRQLNSKTVRDAYPLPRIEEALDVLGKAQLFSTLDLTSGYWQVQMEEEDIPKTAFTTPMGLFECNRMPFGLSNAPATFQRLMMVCLGEQNYVTCLLYLDDIIVFSANFEEHIERLGKVFSCLRRHGLKLKPSKCSLLQEEVKYLGHVVSGKGIATDPDKTAQVKDWPTPTNRKELRRFLGFTGYYRRFIKGYAQIVSPLYKLTSGDPKRKKKGAKRRSPSEPPPFVWSTECQEAMSQLIKGAHDVKLQSLHSPIMNTLSYYRPMHLG